MSKARKRRRSSYKELEGVQGGKPTRSGSFLYRKSGNKEVACERSSGVTLSQVQSTRLEANLVLAK